MKYVLTIAGSDSSGGAGIQADIKTITSLGGHALTAITAVTAQNSEGIDAIHVIADEMISRQVDMLINDVFPDSVKTGMLPTSEAIEAVADLIKRHNLNNIVVDPVLRASSGRQLMDDSAVTILKEVLLPLVGLITPNLDEAEVLAGMRVRNQGDMEKAAKRIKGYGPDVIVTGGHLEGECIDVLYNGKEVYKFKGKKIATNNSHGSGCVFSCSLATYLAMGHDTVKAAEQAHAFTRDAIKQGYSWGGRYGVVNPANLEFCSINW
jgi:hydroxymethylpyrimidine kinase/phosphomethylpyrimidine kinase